MTASAVLPIDATIACLLTLPVLIVILLRLVIVFVFIVFFALSLVIEHGPIRILSSQASASTFIGIIIVIIGTVQYRADSVHR
jgi:hypothetical protein